MKYQSEAELALGLCWFFALIYGHLNRRVMQSDHETKVQYWNWFKGRSDLVSWRTPYRNCFVPSVKHNMWTLFDVCSVSCIEDDLKSQVWPLSWLITFSKYNRFSLLQIARHAYERAQLSNTKVSLFKLEPLRRICFSFWDDLYLDKRD